VTATANESAATPIRRLIRSRATVVYDVNFLVTAAAGGNSPFRSWPSPPPVSGNPSADCLGIVVDAAELALWLSPHITANVERILSDLLKWERPEASAYLEAVAGAAEHSGGGVLDEVPRTARCSTREIRTPLHRRSSTPWIPEGVAANSCAAARYSVKIDAL
jgi:hypothetical protein